MSQRRFGVEIEFNTIGGERERFEEHRCSCGCNQWVYGDEYYDYRDDARGHSKVLDFLRAERLYERGWTDLGWDGSELELRSPILRGKDGFAQLKAVMDGLVDMGCGTTYEDGLHVHHDAPEFVNNKDLTLLMLKSWIANRKLVYGTFVSEERDNSWACPALLERDVSSFENEDNPWGDRNDLNYHALREHGTFELRCKEGTLDYNDAEAWIKFGQTLIDNVARRSKRPITTCADTTALLRRIKAPAKVMRHYGVATPAKRLTALAA